MLHEDYSVNDFFSNLAIFMTIYAYCISQTQQTTCTVHHAPQTSVSVSMHYCYTTTILNVIRAPVKKNTSPLLFIYTEQFILYTAVFSLG